MAASKSKGIPSWQRSGASTSDPAAAASKDDPVYAQQEAATHSSTSDSSSPSSSTESRQNDDPVYAQATAQKRLSDAEPQPSEQSEITSTPQSLDEHTSRAPLLDSASKFLQHEDLRTASLERKKAFLQEKGLTKDEIEGLIESASPTMATETPAQTSSPSSPTAPPPIITYPEFLLHAHRPKPLVTRTRIVNAVYATGLISGALYLANRYVFEPMAEEMANARHELFGSAQKGIDGLNERLEKNVSVVPAVRRGVIDDDDGVESLASDPDELFHRDIGVQTELETASTKYEAKAEDSTTEQTSQLQVLRRHMMTLSETSKDVLEEDEATRSVVGDLQAYLDELAHGGRKSAFAWENGYESTNSGGKGTVGKLDEIAKFKAEIRSVKGALLSARNFPASGQSNWRTR